MRQEELVRFVDELAKAEQAAQEKIAKAEAEAKAELEAHAEALRQKNEDELKRLARDWDEKEKQAMQEAQARINRMRARTDERIAAMKQRHAEAFDTCVAWALDKVLGDA